MSARRSPQLVPVTPRGGVWSRCPPARATVRAVTSTKHEPGLSPSYRVVSYGQALEVWTFLMRHHQCARSEGFVVVPLQRAACTHIFSVIGEAGAKQCFSLCSTEQPSQIQNQPEFRATQRTGPTGKPLQSRPQKILSPPVSVSPLVLQLCRCWTGFQHAWRTIFCNSEDPNELGDDSTFFAVTQHQWRACVRRLLRCKLACVLPPSSLDFRSASGAFDVAKNENRGRFIGDRRRLNSCERSIGWAQLPYCSRLRHMILDKSETVQITFGDTKDCFLLVRSSSFTRDETGDRVRIPRS